MRAHLARRHAAGIGDIADIAQVAGDASPRTQQDEGRLRAILDLLRGAATYRASRRRHARPKARGRERPGRGNSTLRGSGERWRAARRRLRSTIPRSRRAPPRPPRLRSCSSRHAWRPPRESQEMLAVSLTDEADSYGPSPAGSAGLARRRWTACSARAGASGHAAAAMGAVLQSPGLDRRHHLELAQADMPGMGLPPRGAMGAEDVSDLQPWPGHAPPKATPDLVAGSCPAASSALRRG